MKNLHQIAQTLDSREVAEMVEKTHAKLLRDIRRYVEQFNEANIGFVDFFKESAYKDNKGEARPYYQITKKGCEFIAHKLTGTKGTIFTARYINRFHEMEEDLHNNIIHKDIDVICRSIEKQNRRLKTLEKQFMVNDNHMFSLIGGKNDSYRREILRILKVIWFCESESMWRQIYTVLHCFEKNMGVYFKDDLSA